MLGTTFLFVAGINTLFQTWFGTRLPVAMEASYALIIPIISFNLSRRFSLYIDPHQVGFHILLLPFPFLRTLSGSRTE
ncbi:hypothetical protein I3843_05G018900 [Carya illinoinensis]|nr:hypothetical protein I3843_05G018900 [Carya illinoinensis]